MTLPERLAVAAVLSAALSAALAAPAAAQETAAPAAAPAVPEGGADFVVATVNGTPITLGHMIVMRARLPAEYQALPDAMLFSGILEQLIQQAALASQDGATLSKGAELALENERRQFLAGEVVNALVADAASEAAIAAAYAERYAAAAPQQEFNASHILVGTEGEAAAIRAELDAGADFATLALERSAGPSGANAGELGWFTQGMMVEPFEAAVLALEPGQISAPVQTQFGWHIIRLNEVRLKAAPPLEEVREAIVQELRAAAVEAEVARVTAAARVERTDAGLDPALLRAFDLVAD